MDRIDKWESIFRRAMEVGAAQACYEFKIKRSTYYRNRKLHEDEGLTGMLLQPVKHRTGHFRDNPELKKMIREIIAENPGLGSRKIADRLPIQKKPSGTTVLKILADMGLIDKKQKSILAASAGLSNNGNKQVLRPGDCLYLALFKDFRISGSEPTPFLICIDKATALIITKAAAVLNHETVTGIVATAFRILERKPEELIIARNGNRYFKLDAEILKWRMSIEAKITIEGRWGKNIIHHRTRFLEILKDELKTVDSTLEETLQRASDKYNFEVKDSRPPCLGLTPIARFRQIRPALSLPTN